MKPVTLAEVEAARPMMRGEGDDMAHEYEIRGNYGYGHGFEAVTTEPCKSLARERLKEYRENEPGVPFRVVRVRASSVVRVKLYRAGRRGSVAALLIDKHRDGYGVPWASFEREWHGTRVFGFCYTLPGMGPLGHSFPASKRAPDVRRLLDALARHEGQAVEVVK